MNPYINTLNRAEWTAENFDRAILWDELVGMAFEERTGEVLHPGQRYTVEDARRANELMRAYPGPGA